MTDYIEWLESEIKATQSTIDKWVSTTGSAPAFSTGYMQALQTCLVRAKKHKEQNDEFCQQCLNTEAEWICDIDIRLWSIE